MVLALAIQLIAAASPYGTRAAIGRTAKAPSNSLRFGCRWSLRHERPRYGKSSRGAVSAVFFQPVYPICGCNGTTSLGNSERQMRNALNERGVGRMSDWRLADTAPLDVSLLVYDPEWPEPIIAKRENWYGKPEWWWYSGDDTCRCNPTHWMPLPPPPQ